MGKVPSQNDSLIGNIFREVVKKTDILPSDLLKGGESAPSALTVRKCENFDTFFSIEIWFFHIQNTFYLIVRDLKNVFLMPFTPLLYSYPTILWQSNSKQ